MKDLAWLPNDVRGVRNGGQSRSRMRMVSPTSAPMFPKRSTLLRRSECLLQAAIPELHHDAWTWSKNSGTSSRPTLESMA